MPDHHGAPHFEPTTYGKEAAGDWLRDEERRLNAEGAAWATLAEHAQAERARAKREAVVTFTEFSASWLRARRTKNGPLQESTRRSYRIWPDKYLLPTLGHLPLDQITPTVVLRWYEDALPHDKPKTTRECYALGSAIMGTATAADGVLAGAVNRFNIDGAGSIGARSRARIAVIDEHDLRLIAHGNSGASGPGMTCTSRCRERSGMGHTRSRVPAAVDLQVPGIGWS